MATFKIVDELNAPLISTETPSTSGLGKYLPAPVLELMALRPLAKALNKPLADTATTPSRPSSRPERRCRWPGLVRPRSRPAPAWVWGYTRAANSSSRQTTCVTR